MELKLLYAYGKSLEPDDASLNARYKDGGTTTTTTTTITTTTITNSVNIKIKYTRTYVIL